MKKIILVFIAIMLWHISISQKPLYKDKNADIEERVKDLVDRMTLREKILQLTQLTAGNNPYENNIDNATKEIPNEIGSLIYFDTEPELRNAIQKEAMEESRLGIPVLFGYDVIHGYRTIYPISLGVACSWNPDLVKKACGIAAKESKLSGIDWTFSPMIDVARDARWGRIAEGYGEDPYTNSVFGVACVKGYQGEKLSDEYSIAACLKHYVGYGESEGGRDYHYSDISMQSLWETYLVPYEACVKAGAASLMSGFNDISGIPASANYYTLTEILKDRWGHDGFVISDWYSIKQLIPQGLAANSKEAVMKAFNAGVDMDMVDKVYMNNLEELVNEGKISTQKIDDAVSRILRIKFRLGLFDQPYTPIVPEDKRYLSAFDRNVAGELAAESMVLLKNNNNILPLKAVEQIALIGPMANDKVNLLGNWFAHGNPNDVESLREGIEKEFTGVSINYARGCDFNGIDESGFAKALATVQKSDVVVVCLGEKREWSGENASHSTLALPEIQEKLVQLLKSAGKPIVLVLSNGRPLELMRLEPLADAIIEIWQPGVSGGAALAGILSGRINPSGKLSITFPLSTGQIPVYYNMRQSSRPEQGKYQDISTEPLYWFGYGLSYTTYNYSNIKLSATKIAKNERLIAEVEVSNNGPMTGKETVMWFINDPSASISRPIKELKFFEKKEINAGQKVIYRFEIDPMRDLSFPDNDGQRRLEAGEFYLLVNDEKIKFELIN
jgi:beta-glucosidase